MTNPLIAEARQWDDEGVAYTYNLISRLADALENAEAKLAEEDAEIIELRDLLLRTWDEKRAEGFAEAKALYEIKSDTTDREIAAQVVEGLTDQSEGRMDLPKEIDERIHELAGTEWGGPQIAVAVNNLRAAIASYVREQRRFAWQNGYDKGCADAIGVVT